MEFIIPNFNTNDVEFVRSLRYCSKGALALAISQRAFLECVKA